MTRMKTLTKPVTRKGIAVTLIDKLNKCYV